MSQRDRLETGGAVEYYVILRKRKYRKVLMGGYTRIKERWHGQKSVWFGKGLEGFSMDEWESIMMWRKSRKYISDY